MFIFAVAPEKIVDEEQTTLFVFILVYFKEETTFAHWGKLCFRDATYDFTFLCHKIQENHMS